MPSKQRHSDLPAGGSETATHHGTEGRKRHLASRVHCLTLPSEPTRNQLQSAAPMPSKQLHSDLPAGGSETAKHHGTEGRKRRLASRLQCLTLPSEPTRNQLQSAAPMPSKQLHSDLPAGGSETAKHHGTEGRKRRLASRLHCLTLPSEPTRNQLQSAAPMPSKQLHSDLPAGGSEAAKDHGTEGRKRHLASRLHCLTLPSEPTRNQLQSAAPMPSKQLHSEVSAGGSETATHHGMPVCLSACLHVCLSVCLHLASRLQCLTLPSEPTRNQLQSAAPMPSKQLHSDLPAGGSETAKHHGTEGRKRRLASRVHCLTTDKKPAPKCSSHALKTAPQRPPSGRFRNSKTPWH